MKCPNCNVQASEGDEYCPECRYYLVEDNQEEIGVFIKDAVVSPWKSIGRPYRVKTALTVAVIMLILFSTVGIPQLAGLYNDPGFEGLEFLLVVIPNFFVLSVIFLIFYFITVMFQGMVTKDAEVGEQVFTDFSKINVLLYVIYLLFALTTTLLPANVEMILWFVIYFLTISVPVFVTAKYAGNGNAKHNILLSVLIYYVVLNIPVVYFTFLYFYNYA